MVDNTNEKLTQNSLPGRAPGFCTRPFWYMAGLEKKVKIGSMDFNYIDYLEAWLNFNCYTYRSREVLDRIKVKIKKAFETIEGKTSSNKKKNWPGKKRGKFNNKKNKN